MSRPLSFQTEPVVSKKMRGMRLPVDKTGGFKFPPMTDPSVKAMYDTRTVTLISEKNFKRLYRGFRKEDLFIGTLKLL